MFFNIPIQIKELENIFDNFFSLTSLNEKDVVKFFTLNEKFIEYKHQDETQEAYKTILFAHYLIKKYKLKIKLDEILDYEIDVESLFKNKNEIYYYDKAIDILNIKHVDGKKNSILSDYVDEMSKLFLLQELVFYVSLNMTHITIKQSDLIQNLVVKPVDEMRKAMRRRVFALALETDSQLTTYDDLRKASELFFKDISKQRKKEIIDYFLNIFCDKVFFINLKCKAILILDKKELIAIKMLVKFFTIIFIADLAKQKLHIQSSVFEEFKISKEILNEIKSVNLALAYLDKGFMLSDNDLISVRQNIDYAHTISLYAKKLSSLSNGLNASGDYFEAYVKEYIGENISENYTIYSGINPQISPYQNVDIDLILKDNHENKFYFIQLKYSYRERIAYLDEELKLYLKNKKLIHKGIAKQLMDAKLYLDEPEFQKLLNANGVYEANSQNTFFILLHNITIFDFVQFGEFAMYEWNSFRNILQRGTISVRHSNMGHINTMKQDHNLKIEDVDSVIDEYFKPNRFTNYSKIWSNFIESKIVLDDCITTYVR